MTKDGLGELGQWLRAHVALVEDSTFSFQLAHSHVATVQGNRAPSLGFYWLLCA